MVYNLYILQQNLDLVYEPEESGWVMNESGVIGISLIGGRFLLKDVLELMVEDVSKMLEIGLVSCVVTLRGCVVRTV